MELLEKCGQPSSLPLMTSFALASLSIWIYAVLIPLLVFHAHELGSKNSSRSNFLLKVLFTPAAERDRDL
ncbi:hypothetical protein ACFX12_044762 [Malus domestica]